MAVQTKLLFQLLKQEGNEVVLIPANLNFPSGFAFLSKVAFLRTIVRFLLFSHAIWRACNKVDLHHVMTNSYASFFLVTLPVILISKLRKIPVVVNYRGGLAKEFLNRYHLLVKPVLSHANVVVVPNVFLKSIFAEFKINTIGVPNILTFEFQNHKNAATQNGKIRLLVCRQLEALYNIPCALQAFRRIKQNWPNAELRIAGEGSLRRILEDMVSEQNLEDVKFLGGLDASKMQNEYTTAKVMINPTNADNMPISVLEAQASGVPVVSTNVGGIPYLIKDGETGLLVAADDDRGIAAAVDRILREPDLYQKISRKAKLAVRQYSWSNVRNKWIKVYIDVLESQR